MNNKVKTIIIQCLMHLLGIVVVIYIIGGLKETHSIATMFAYVYGMFVYRYISKIEYK